MERAIEKNYIKELLETKDPGKGWYFKPCPFCGTSNIGVKDTTIDYNMGHDAPCTAVRKIWAYCRYCGSSGPSTTQEVIGDDEEIAAAIVKWNERKGS
jgi:Lar family restriction alleviation protein